MATFSFFAISASVSPRFAVYQFNDASSAAAGFFFGEFGRNAAFLWGAALVAGALLVAFKLTRGLGAAKLTGPEPAEPTR